MLLDSPFEPLKHFFKVYINGFAGAADLRAKLMECKTTDEVRRIMGFTKNSISTQIVSETNHD